MFIWRAGDVSLPLSAMEAGNGPGALTLGRGAGSHPLNTASGHKTSLELSGRPGYTMVEEPHGALTSGCHGWLPKHLHQTSGATVWWTRPWEKQAFSLGKNTLPRNLFQLLEASGSPQLSHQEVAANRPDQIPLQPGRPGLENQESATAAQPALLIRVRPPTLHETKTSFLGDVTLWSGTITKTSSQCQGNNRRHKSFLCEQAECFIYSGRCKASYVLAIRPMFFM